MLPLRFWVNRDTLGLSKPIGGLPHLPRGGSDKEVVHMSISSQEESRLNHRVEEPGGGPVGSPVCQGVAQPPSFSADAFFPTDTPPRTDALDAGIDAAVDWLLRRRRRESGRQEGCREAYWVAPLQSNSCMEAQWILAMHVLGVRDDPKYDGVVRAILREQRPDGSWEVYPRRAGRRRQRDRRVLRRAPLCRFRRRQRAGPQGARGGFSPRRRFRAFGSSRGIGWP